MTDDDGFSVPEELNARSLSECGRQSYRGLRKDALFLADQRPCPMVDGVSGVIRMTRGGFARACVKIRRSTLSGFAKANTLGGGPCRGCDVGLKIKRGRTFTPPDKIEFIDITEE